LTRQGDQPTVGYDQKTLVRYFNPANPYDHWCTTSTSTGYPVEGNLRMLAANSLPGTRPLYDQPRVLIEQDVEQLNNAR
jgi:hypothetical protein